MGNENFLEKYGIKRADLLAAIEALNGFEHSPVAINVEGKSDFDLVACFMAIMHNIPADYGKLTPPVAVTFYEKGLPEALFGKETEIDTSVETKMLVQMREEAAAAAVEDTGDTGEEDTGDVTHECPVFGKQNLDEPDCKDCKDQFPDEFAACTAETAKAGEEAKGKKGKKGPKGPKAKKVKEPKPPKEKKVKEPKPPKEKVVSKRSRYGHMDGTMSGDIDECLWIGGHIDQITSFIANKHGKELSAARAKIRGHISWLIQSKGVPVLETDGILKAQVEFAKDRDATNSVFAEVTLPEYVPPVEPAAEPAAAPAGDADPAASTPAAE